MIALMSVAGEWFAGKYGLFVVVEESVLGLSASWGRGVGMWREGGPGKELFRSLFLRVPSAFCAVLCAESSETRFYRSLDNAAVIILWHLLGRKMGWIALVFDIFLSPSRFPLSSTQAPRNSATAIRTQKPGLGIGETPSRAHRYSKYRLPCTMRLEFFA